MEFYFIFLFQFPCIPAPVFIHEFIRKVQWEIKGCEKKSYVRSIFEHEEIKSLLVLLCVCGEMAKKRREDFFTFFSLVLQVIYRWHFGTLQNGTTKNESKSQSR